MKHIKYIISFILLILIGMITSYANTNINNEIKYDKLVETFNDTQADFKFYNIKANATIDYNISRDKLREISMEIIRNLGLEESDLKWDEVENNNKNHVFTQAKTGDKSISIACIKKNKQESYIMVDILDNKGYKDIVDIYAIIESILNTESSNLEIYTCMAGEYTKKLQINKYDDILQNILYNMNAEEIDRVQEENFVSLTAYSKMLDNGENYLEYLGNRINLNIGMRYSEDEEKTLIYIATPIIKLDY